jgi:hypothetical protein
MKRVFIFLTSLIILMSLSYWYACKSDQNEDPSNGWTEADQQAFDQMQSLQEQSSTVFDTYLQTLDSSAAKDALLGWYLSDPSVEWAVASDQGISVQYKSGFAGGIILDPEDHPEIEIIYPNQENLYKSTTDKVGSAYVMPNSKKALLYDPHYAERVKYTDAVISSYKACLPSVGMQLAEQDIYLNDKANLEVLKHLTGYGYIHLYAHGYAWPSNSSITEVYMLTGQKISTDVIKKYEKEIKSRELCNLYFHLTKKHHWFVSPKFITDNNDFSQDTVLIYGGFCYAYLGTWSSIVDKMAAGSYLGADWAVLASYCTVWARDMVSYMTNTNITQPKTLNDWFTENHGMAMHYTANNREVSIKYSGRGDLRLWKKITTAISTSTPGGAPVTSPGKKNTLYTFESVTEGAPVESLKFKWDFGDGSPVEEIIQNNQVTHAWENSGTFSMTVEALDISTLESLASDTVQVIIQPDLDLIPILHNLKHVEVSLYSNNHHYWDNGTPIDDAYMWISSQSMGEMGYKIIWDGLNFDATGTTVGGNNISIQGKVSADGTMVEHVIAHTWYPNNHDYTFELANVPFSEYNQSNPDVIYTMTGSQTQGHVMTLQMSNPYLGNYSSSDWDYVTLKVYFFSAR